MKTMTYRQALAFPAKNGGWSHMERGCDSLDVVVAQSLGLKFCIRPESVYKWAKSQNIILQDTVKTFIDNPDLLLVCVLNDWTINQALTELKLAGGESI